VPATEHLGRQFLYHEAHLNDRESIREQGLRPGRPISMGDKMYPAGVYLSKHGASEYGSSMNDSSHFGYDRWRADVTGLNVHTDPMQPESAHYTPDTIPADRIKLVKKGHPNWQKHI